jgi:hypothetical protein
VKASLHQLQVEPRIRSKLIVRRARRGARKGGCEEEDEDD